MLKRSMVLGGVLLVAAGVSAATVEELRTKAAALVAQMTVEEKCAQLRNEAPAIPRLGIPAYNYWSEALHGVGRNGRATMFPMPIGMAASFDPELVREIADAIATEGRREARGRVRRRAAAAHGIRRGRSRPSRAGRMHVFGSIVIRTPSRPAAGLSK